MSRDHRHALADDRRRGEGSGVGEGGTGWVVVAVVVGDTFCAARESRGQRKSERKKERRKKKREGRERKRC